MFGDLPGCQQLLTPKSRKQHLCCECHGVIEIGERYYKHSGVWDGEPSTFKICGDCEELIDLLRSICDFQSDEGIEFGGLFDEILEHGRKDLSEIFIEIATKRKSASLQKYMEWQL